MENGAESPETLHPDVQEVEMLARHKVGAELEALIRGQVEDVTKYNGYLRDELKRLAPSTPTLEIDDIVGLSRCIAQIVAEAAYRLGIEAGKNPA